MVYIFLIVLVAGFIWFILSRIGKGYYESKEESKNPTKYRLRKLLHENGLDYFYDKLVCDPRFDSNPEYRKKALDVIESILEYRHSQKFEQDLDEELGKGGNFGEVIKRLAEKRGYDKGG